MTTSSVSLKRLCYHLYKQVCAEIITALLRVSYHVFSSYKG